jgi:protein-histidine pros-kinase
VSEPVLDLLRGFQEVGAGNFAPVIREPKEPVLQLLVAQFQHSVRQVRRVILEKEVYSEQLLTTARELEELNDTLEGKIAERTQSLENAVQMLEYSNRKIQEADRLKSEFLANMSHELRTPLNAVIGFSELLLERIPGPLTADQEQCLGDVLQSGQHLLKLINEILDLSKVEAGKMPVNFTTRPMEELLGEVQALFRPLLAKKGQTLTVRCASPGESVYTDQNKLKQILINLLSNAHKFSPEGAEVALDVETSERGHRFSVTDRGVGIAPENLEHIFEAFRQLDGSASRVQEGTGLGLTLCRRFSHLLGGALTVESHVGRGSTFTLLLPTEPSRPIGREVIEEAPDGASAAG